MNVVEQLQVKANKAKGYDILVNDDTVTLITMENAKWAARQTWDTGEFKDAKKAVRAKYPSSHVHAATSCAAIMAILAEVDEARDLSRATVPTGIALSVDKGISFLNALTNGMDQGEFFAIASNSGSLVEKNRVAARRGVREHADAA